MSDLLICQWDENTPPLHVSSTVDEITSRTSRRAVEVKSVHDHPLLLHIRPSHTTEQSNVHGSCGPLSLWWMADKQVAAVGPHAEAKPDFLLRQKKRLPVPRAYSRACRTPPHTGVFSQGPLMGFAVGFAFGSYWEGLGD